MSAELVSRIVEAFNRCDVEAVIADMGPEVEFISKRAPIHGSKVQPSSRSRAGSVTRRR